MERDVDFRDFEERDIDFIYRCKNDKKLNSMIVGDYHPFSYKEAENWVHGCMGNHETYKFWAICTNDAEKRIVGWVSLSNIDKNNRSACFHGIVLGDEDYHDGFAWIESYLFIMEYTFGKLHLNRLYGSFLVGHTVSNYASDLLLWTTEGILRQAIFRDGKFYDLKLSSILQEEYNHHITNGAYTMSSIIERISQNRKRKTFLL